MFERLLLSLSFLTAPVISEDPNYVPDVAAEAAYASLLKTNAPSKPKPDTKDCTTCNGTGRVRTGDGQGWTKCPDCENRTGMKKIDGPTEKVIAPGQGWPARNISSDDN